MRQRKPDHLTSNLAKQFSPNQDKFRTEIQNKPEKQTRRSADAFSLQTAGRQLDIDERRTVLRQTHRDRRFHWSCQDASRGLRKL